MYKLWFGICLVLVLQTAAVEVLVHRLVSDSLMDRARQQGLAEVWMYDEQIRTLFSEVAGNLTRLGSSLSLAKDDSEKVRDLLVELEGGFTRTGLAGSFVAFRGGPMITSRPWMPLNDQVSALWENLRRGDAPGWSLGQPVSSWAYGQMTYFVGNPYRVGQTTAIPIRVLLQYQGEVRGVAGTDLYASSFLPQWPDISTNQPYFANPEVPLVLFDADGHLLLDKRSAGSLLPGQTAPISGDPLGAMVRGAGREGMVVYVRDGQKRISTFVKDPDLGWVVAVERTYDRVMSPHTRLLWSILLITAASFGAAALLGLGVGRLITNRLRQMTQAARQIADGRFDVALPVGAGDETGVLASAFNRMAGRLRQVLAAMTEQDRLRHQAEFAALQARIRPHFLHNALNSIRWMAEVESAPRTSEMSIRLGHLLSFTARNQRAFILVDEEVSLVQDLVAFELIRSGNTFCADYEIDHTARHCVTLPMLIQPLVENAIIHGIRAAGGGRIIIRINKLEDKLVFEVEDSGPGFGEKTSDQDMGLANVRERLALRFGGEASLELATGSLGGALVRITHPVLGEEVLAHGVQGVVG